MGYILNFLISIDQLGNVIAGGDPDNTISARVGFYNHHYPDEKKVTAFWKLFEWIINTTFWPVDGPDHCHEAYHNDAGEFFDTGTKDWAVVILFFLITLSCIFIAAFLYILYLVGVVSPKKIDRTQNIQKRLHSIHASLNGTLNELKEYPLPENKQLIEDAILNIDCANAILTVLENPPKEPYKKI